MRIFEQRRQGYIQYSYDKLGQVSMTITTSKENIEKIKDNYQHYQDEINYEDF